MGGFFVLDLMCSFYILYSEKIDQFYIGFTCDTILERIRKHNSNHKGFTGRTNDWKLVHLEIYNSKEEAFERERVVKGWKSRKKIEQLIDKE